MLNRYADIILPIAFKGHFTYVIPPHLSDMVVAGSGVSVPLGNRKVCTGIVARVHNSDPSFGNIREILGVSVDLPLINQRQLKLWHWISEYYMCSIGEVLKAAVPSLLLPEGLTGSIPASEYRPKTGKHVILSDRLSTSSLENIIPGLSRSPRQYDTMMAFLHLSGINEPGEMHSVPRDRLLKEKGVSAAAITALIRKNILRQVEVEVEPERLRGREAGDGSVPKALSGIQNNALNSIREQFKVKDIVLLHGVTSSGKTEIYIHLIEEQLLKGKQVLYLLPEIALTGQVVARLMTHFGNRTGVYHSRFNENERIEIWKNVAQGNKCYDLIIGVRSSLFLPFSDLGLIIIDEEHDTSYKQQDPAPRYNGRDTASVLASIHSASCLMGSASPSVESYHNAVTGKYGLVNLDERFGAIRLPEIIVADSREARRKKLMVSHFTPPMLEAIDKALGRHEQVILFQNRRGFSPYIQCPECGWIPVCTRCSVNLTYHKGISRLICHYCGYSTGLPGSCGSCGSQGLATKGFGTEKVEDEIKIIFPSARVARMDQDTTSSKNAFNRIIRSFEEGKTDILIGTQMIAKGLDFENLTVVGILNADNMLNYPDFRAHERSFQLMAQVSGRAGRRQKQGRVIIQTGDPQHEIIKMVLRHDYKSMYEQQSVERRKFNYPPFCRMIRIAVKHKDKPTLNEISSVLGNELRNDFGKRVLGPEYPVIAMVQLWHIKNIIIKIEKERPVAEAKKIILKAIDSVMKIKGAGSVRINIDVDPY